MSKGTGLNLPKEVERQKPTLSLFITYLKQRSTKDALLALAIKKDRFKETSNYIHTLTIIVGSIKDKKGLCRLAEQAPALYAIVKLASDLGPATIPPSALPSEACMNALLKWYHEWVQHQAQGKGD